jgi:hypothetical protein
VDREAMAREQRRRQVLQALEFERDREGALVEQLYEVAAEADGARVDEAAFARMEPDEVALVRDLLDAYAPPDEDEEPAADDEEADETDPLAEELDRLEGELASCRARQAAYARYLDALAG